MTETKTLTQAKTDLEKIAKQILNLGNGLRGTKNSFFTLKNGHKFEINIGHVQAVFELTDRAKKLVEADFTENETRETTCEKLELTFDKIESPGNSFISESDNQSSASLKSESLSLRSRSRSRCPTPRSQSETRSTSSFDDRDGQRVPKDYQRYQRYQKFKSARKTFGSSSRTSRSRYSKSVFKSRSPDERNQKLQKRSSSCNRDDTFSPQLHHNKTRSQINNTRRATQSYYYILPENLSKIKYQKFSYHRERELEMRKTAPKVDLYQCTFKVLMHRGREIENCSGTADRGRRQQQMITSYEICMKSKFVDHDHYDEKTGKVIHKFRPRFKSKEELNRSFGDTIANQRSKNFSHPCQKRRFTERRHQSPTDTTSHSKQPNKYFKMPRSNTPKSSRSRSPQERNLAGRLGQKIANSTCNYQGYKPSSIDSAALKSKNLKVENVKIYKEEVFEDSDDF